MMILTQELLISSVLLIVVQTIKINNLIAYSNSIESKQ